MVPHVFEPAALHDVARAHAGRPLPQVLDALLGDLEARYPGRIHRDQPWIFSNAGGAMVQMKVLYASLTEYVMLLGTPIGTEGHSGRHWVEFHDTVLFGEAWYYHEGQLDKTVYRSGDRIVLRRSAAAGFRVPGEVWMLEYARGAIPLSLPFGLADSLFSTLDLVTVARSLRVYAKLMVRSLSPGRAAHR